MVHTFYNFVQTITVLKEASNDFYNIRRINPNGAVGHTVPAVFSEGYFSLEKGVLRSEIS